MSIGRPKVYELVSTCGSLVDESSAFWFWENERKSSSCYALHGVPIAIHIVGVSVMDHWQAQTCWQGRKLVLSLQQDTFHLLVFFFSPPLYTHTQSSAQRYLKLKIVSPTNRSANKVTLSHSLSVRSALTVVVRVFRLVTIVFSPALFPIWLHLAWFLLRMCFTGIDLHILFLSPSLVFYGFCRCRAVNWLQVLYV